MGATNTNAGMSIFGLLAFGLVSMLFGLSQLPGPYGHGFDLPIAANLYVTGATVSLTMTTLGGVALFLVGIVMFLKSAEPYWAVAFTGYGAFWAILGTVATTAANYSTYGYGTAGFALVWMLFTLTLLISSFKHGWMTFLFYLVLFIGLALLVVEFWQWGAGGATTKISGDELGVIGGFWIAAGILAWYGGTSRLTELNWGRKLLPL